MNMSYCRFRNTLSDLKDCYENLPYKTGEMLSKDEAHAFADLIQLARDIASRYEGEEEDELLEGAMCMEDLEDEEVEEYYRQND